MCVCGGSVGVSVWGVCVRVSVSACVCVMGRRRVFDDRRR